MSLPKTIWWCETHRAGHVGTCDYPQVALPVAGPDDLVIRRGDIDYEAAGNVRVGRIIDAGRAELVLGMDVVQAIVDAALAAAEGGEKKSRSGVAKRPARDSY